MYELGKFINFIKLFRQRQIPNGYNLDQIIDSTYPELMSSSDVNDYVPFFAPFMSEVFTLEDSQARKKHFSIYSLPKDPRPNSRTRSTYDSVFDTLGDQLVPERYYFGESYFVLKGCVYKVVNDVPIVQMCLAIKPNYIWDIGSRGINPMTLATNQIEMKNFALYFNTSFRSERLGKRILKDYVSLLIEGGVDVIYSSDINDRLFKSPITMPQFNTMQESLEHFRSLNSMING